MGRSSTSSLDNKEDSESDVALLSPKDPDRVHAKEQLAHPVSSNLDPSMQGLPAGLSLDDFIPGHLRAHIGASSRGTRVSEQQGKRNADEPAVDGDTSGPGGGSSGPAV